MSRLDAALAAIDVANTQDPDTHEGRPAALLYGERMSDELARLFPDASDVLQIAARGQHIERWTSPRDSYPEGRAGYLAWRRDLGAFHARRVAEIMRDAGYDEAEAERAGTLLRKEGIKRDAEVQALEDVICFVFLRWYFAPFADGRDADALLRIVEKTARKMSANARARALREFSLPESLAAAFQG
ncbi:DUF4202 domain-containing protein [Defluviimonas sp. WL0075]|uniref:DUF4202 domain-containing protein n=1 Tax=Albidovulum sediminicola TaxID=2984331 RepID=A0ABT2YZL0_9RHOB|nr:DUF4202 domain-containing protein [Defluviimonas sp. WL0075]MCV2864297.1 DUF4202 domain-containing protein [Defluviimonas sp. WL0075]